EFLQRVGVEGGEPAVHHGLAQPDLQVRLCSPLQVGVAHALPLRLAREHALRVARHVAHRLVVGERLSEHQVTPPAGDLSLGQGVQVRDDLLRLAPQVLRPHLDCVHSTTPHSVTSRSSTTPPSERTRSSVSSRSSRNTLPARLRIAPGGGLSLGHRTRRSTIRSSTVYARWFVYSCSVTCAPRTPRA